MDETLRKYILIQAAASFVINAVINGLIIFLLAWGKEVYTAGWVNILITFAIDNLITCSILGLFGADGAVKNLKKEKTLFTLPPAAGIAWLSRRMKKPKRWGLLLGCIAFLLIFGLSTAGVFLFQIETLTKWGYVFYKGIYTGALGAGFSVLFLNAGLRQSDEIPQGVTRDEAL